MTSGGFKRTPLLDRVWHNLWVPATGSCLIWGGPLSAKGYGLVCVGGKQGRMRRVHIVMWESQHGPVPEGQQLNHTCHNTPCVNWRHMYTGTHQQNMADRKRPPISEGTPPSQIRELLTIIMSTNRKKVGVNGW